MKDRLPLMSIKIDTTPEEFLRRIEAMARQIGEFVVESERDLAGDGEVNALRLKPILVTHHRELTGRIIIIPASHDRVNVEVNAARWHPDPPTFRAYVTAAREIFKPLLHQYNLKFHSNRKLQIQSQAATEPRLPAIASQVFNRFVDRANKSALRNRDWQRFYHFIWHCAAYNINLNRDDVHRLLVNAGFTIEHAADLADIFEHGRALLKRDWKD
ncbi:MAG: hypothetical protein JSU77_10710 [Fidelibacterota bacterium]|nr:MAG: hypothetical protein JSU77_10710 [Candidatus Neomarinimicrobiota bacterium]